MITKLRTKLIMFLAGKSISVFINFIAISGGIKSTGKKGICIEHIKQCQLDFTDKDCVVIKSFVTGRK
jgi:hypothetical protein